MKKLISAKLAGNIAIIIIQLLILMHILIISKILPSDFIWGGQITDDASMYRLELIALATSVVFLSMFYIKMISLNNGKSQKVINIFMWLLFIWLTFNIVGNIFSSSTIEKLIFIPVSIILSLASQRLATEK